MPIRISVVIPCYNQAQFLPDAIDSVLAQGRDDVEIIVVNDGSPDETGVVAQRYSDSIVYIEQENRGLSGARNSGIRAAKGDYIALLDSDDQYLPGALDKLSSYLDTHMDVGFVCGDARYYSVEGDAGLKSDGVGHPENPADFRWETVDYYATPSTTMVRRQVFDTVGLFDENLRRAAEDWLMWVSIARCYKMAYIDAPIARYRLHPESAMRNTELVDASNRYAINHIVTSTHFTEYPRHFRARLLYYRFATAWRVESKWQALTYLGQALVADPRQIGYLIFTLQRATLRGHLFRR